MRIIAGTLRSRPLITPHGLDTRPTTDRLRETLFNVLTNGAVNRISDAAFLDLYSGSGAVGIEALSRGAASATFVDQSTPAIAALKKNLHNLGLRGPNIRVEKQSVTRFLRSEAAMTTPIRFDVVFLDPPYELEQEYASTLTLLGGECTTLLNPGALVIAEHRRKQSLDVDYGSLNRVRLLQQGDASLSFYSLQIP